jgi:hypothetical protein
VVRLRLFVPARDIQKDQFDGVCNDIFNQELENALTSSELTDAIQGANRLDTGYLRDRSLRKRDEIQQDAAQTEREFEVAYRRLYAFGGRSAPKKPLLDARPDAYRWLLLLGFLTIVAAFALGRSGSYGASLNLTLIAVAGTSVIAALALGALPDRNDPTRLRQQAVLLSSSAASLFAVCIHVADAV